MTCASLTQECKLMVIAAQTNAQIFKNYLSMDNVNGALNTLDPRQKEENVLQISAQSGNLKKWMELVSRVLILKELLKIRSNALMNA